MKLALIGSGHVAHQLGHALRQANVHITAVASRTSQHGRLLAEKLQATYISDLGGIDPDTDVILIAVSDKAIQEVANQLQPGTSAVVAHTSGATPSSILNKFIHFGVLYPAQSLRKEVAIDPKTIPLGVEGNDHTAQSLLWELASAISDKTFACDSRQRLALHTAAVFANNFTNAMFMIAHGLLQENNLPFDLLLPMIRETAERVQQHIPADVQTGPASRGDNASITRHIDFLKKHPDYQEIYNLVSAFITKNKKPST